LKQYNIIVVGNGISRKDIDLWQLKEDHIVYGCNAVYREFQPDILFCVDDRICNEIHVSGYSKEHTVITPNKYSCPSATHIKTNNKWKKWNCGALACYYAATQLPNTIYLIGFDIGGEEGYRNIYEGSLHYRGRGTERHFTVESATTKQLLWTFHSFPDIQFRRIGGVGIHEFKQCKNYRKIEKLPYDEN
tara:strand:+ start:321 stop:890 length:570 start_codon:yes stop_codon:yes gene_type:complete